MHERLTEDELEFSSLKVVRSKRIFRTEKVPTNAQKQISKIACMKITDIEYYPLQLTVAGDSEIGTDEDPSRQVGASAESMAAQRYKAPETGVILIRTDDGLVGIGDGATLPHYLGHGIGSMVDWMARFRTVLIGADPLNIAGIHQLMEAVADRNPAWMPTRSSRHRYGDI